MSNNFTLKKGFVRLGLEIGDHLDTYEDFIPFITDHYDLKKLDFVLFYISPREVGANMFYEWANFFTENDICFGFLYTQQRGAPEGEISHLTAEIVAKIKEISGDYFIGDMIGETGGLASWPRGYYDYYDYAKKDFKDMQEAKDNYVESVAELVKIDAGLGVDHVLAVEATTFSRYNFEAGVAYTFLEMMCGNPEVLLASARGASRAYNRDLWGCHIAHEWYGGYRNDDPLKYKRLKLAYNYAYMSGANFIYPESGDIGMHSYGYEFDSDNEFCKRYREEWDSFANFLAENARPCNGPETKIAFVQGNLDSYAAWGGTTVWNKFDDEAWGYNDPEYSWNILNEVNSGQKWHEVTVFGSDDLTHAPANGIYDIIPSEAPANIMANYDYLIFTGWNTMTQEIYDNLRTYVKGGGNLIISAAHLNTTAKRDGSIQLLNNGELAEFFGCDIKANGERLNSGVKFFKESLMDGVLYPATGDMACDPICPAGFAEYVDVTLKGGRAAAVFSDNFFMLENEVSKPALVENKYGNGIVSLMTNMDYPGANAVFPFYRTIVKEVMTASHRNGKLKVMASDKVTFSVFSDENGVKTIYILNTDYNVAADVIVLWGDERTELKLQSLEIQSIVLK